MIYRLLICLMVFFLVCCSHKEAQPDDVIPPDKMQDVLWDYMRADAYAAEILRKDSTKNDTLENLRLQQLIFSKYQITNTDFDRSYEYYVAHPKMMNTILDSISAKQNRSDKGKVYFGAN